MSTLKLEHIAHIDNAGPDISIDSSGHLNIVNGNLQMGGVTMLDASNGDLSTGNNASVNIRDAAGEVAGRIRNWSSPTNSIAIESDPLNSAANSYLTFTVDGAQKMTILDSGYVGIGTTTAYSASTDFEVKATDPKIVINNTGQRAFGLLASGTKLYIRDESDDQDIVTITEGGRVGIGTVSPDAPLHIEDSTSSAYGGIRVVGAGTGSGSTNVREIADFGRTNSGSDSGVWLGGRTDETTAVIGAKTASGNIAFEVYQSGWKERMRIKNNGNVGIGTTDPDNYYARDLVVNAADEGGITIVNDTSHQGYLMFADGTSGAETYRGYIGYDHAIDHLQITSGGIVKFLVNNNQEKMSITTSGVIQGASDAEIKTSPIRKHSNTISTNTTIDSSENAIASGPISVATGVTLTINGNMTVV